MGLQDHGFLLFPHLSLPDQAALKCYVLSPPVIKYQRCRLSGGVTARHTMIFCLTKLLWSVNFVWCCVEPGVALSGPYGLFQPGLFCDYLLICIKKEQIIVICGFNKKVEHTDYGPQPVLTCLGRMLHLAQYWVIANWDEWSFSASLWK